MIRVHLSRPLANGRASFAFPKATRLEERGDWVLLTDGTGATQLVIRRSLTAQIEYLP